MTECNYCHKPIKLEATNEINPNTGKTKWKRTNEDGSEHKCGNFSPKVALAPILTANGEKLDKIITLLERISGQLANK